ncbi:MAG: DeoR family transcriptional regulator, fructose operon transcriptional repressor [Fusobacteriaceae bacterium]|jgi:DeoR family fructose operon transcriptional repressor|nr:transcriptional regulator, DeoR family [Fusobacteriales bacterium]MDN5304498.1 DeoR family transcriptional regulator, fructose operon transcriptional repressor [Fusobacteriaceae bacterium]
MLINERYDLIINYLKEKETATVKELTEVTNSSEATIRRDLIELEKKALLKRVHGGATIIDDNIELSMASKTSINKEEKEIIAKFAASLVNDGEYIFLDAGSTTFQIIKYLAKKNIKVVTNGIDHILELAKYNITSYVIGGQIKETTRALIGIEAYEQLLKHNFSRAFLGVNSLSYERGYSTPDTEEALIKKTVINLSKKSYVLADSSKFGKDTFCKFGELKDAIIITDKLMDKRIEEKTIVKECK